jgi:hypothetical protein
MSGITSRLICGAAWGAAWSRRQVPPGQPGPALAWGAGTAEPRSHARARAARRPSTPPATAIRTSIRQSIRTATNPRSRPARRSPRLAYPQVSHSSSFSYPVWEPHRAPRRRRPGPATVAPRARTAGRSVGNHAPVRHCGHGGQLQITGHADFWHHIASFFQFFVVSVFPSFSFMLVVMILP